MLSEIECCDIVTCSVWYDGMGWDVKRGEV